MGRRSMARTEGGPGALTTAAIMSEPMSVLVMVQRTSSINADKHRGIRLRFPTRFCSADGTLPHKPCFLLHLWVSCAASLPVSYTGPLRAPWTQCDSMRSATARSRRSMSTYPRAACPWSMSEPLVTSPQLTRPHAPHLQNMPLRRRPPHHWTARRRLCHLASRNAGL